MILFTRENGHQIVFTYEQMGELRILEDNTFHDEEGDIVATRLTFTNKVVDVSESLEECLERIQAYTDNSGDDYESD